MKATGIVRRIDDLGRVVIPKEIRRTMRIREGDPLEIYTSSEGEVIFKKYSPMGEVLGNAGQYAEVLNKMAGLPTAICDRDHVIAAAGIPKREVLERRITPSLEEAMEARRCISYASEDRPLQPVEGVDKSALVCCPIISEGWPRPPPPSSVNSWRSDFVEPSEIPTDFSSDIWQVFH